MGNRLAYLKSLMNDIIYGDYCSPSMFWENVTDYDGDKTKVVNQLKEIEKQFDSLTTEEINSKLNDIVNEYI